MINLSQKSIQLYSKQVLTISLVLSLSLVFCNNISEADTKITSICAVNSCFIQSPENLSNNELIVGKVIERELVGGNTHSYSINLEANQYLNVVVEQKGIDVVVRVYNPVGEKVYEVDSPNGTEGEEPVYLITKTAGTYNLEIGSLEKNAKQGKYKTKLVEQRLALPTDTDRVAGFKALGEATLLASEGKRENEKLIVSKYEEAIEKLSKVNEIVTKANIINSLANLYYRKEDYIKAEPLYTQALEIRKKALGE
ncbi:MAG: tetratricopeptide repeat protein, partial [Blastocatellia bacterium]